MSTLPLKPSCIMQFYIIYGNVKLSYFFDFRVLTSYKRLVDTFYTYTLCIYGPRITIEENRNLYSNYSIQIKSTTCIYYTSLTKSNLLKSISNK